MIKTLEEQVQAAGPSNPNTQSEVVKATKRKRMSTHTQRHEDRKRKRQTAEENMKRKKRQQCS